MNESSVFFNVLFKEGQNRRPIKRWFELVTSVCVFFSEFKDKFSVIYERCRTLGNPRVSDSSPNDGDSTFWSCCPPSRPPSRLRRAKVRSGEASREAPEGRYANRTRQCPTPTPTPWLNYWNWARRRACCSSCSPGSRSCRRLWRRFGRPGIQF